MTVSVHLAWALREDPDHPDAVARAAVGAALGVEPASVQVGRRCGRCGSRAHGVPVASIAGRASRATLSLSLSLSRSGGAVVAAAALGDAAVGVDLEWTVRDTATLARVVVATDERVPAGDHGLLRLWTRKEAVLKAAGTGLAVDPRHVRLDGLTVLAGPEGPWWLGDLDLAPGLMGTVAARGVDARIVTRTRLDHGQ